MFNVKNKKTGEIHKVYAVRKVEENGEAEFLFNTHCEYSHWYWDDSMYYVPVD